MREDDLSPMLIFSILACNVCVFFGRAKVACLCFAPCNGFQNPVACMQIPPPPSPSPIFPEVMGGLTRIQEILACGIWILGVGIRNTAQGIRNPTKDWMESSTWSPESTTWNPESRTALESLTWGDMFVTLWATSFVLPYTKEDRGALK